MEKTYKILIAGIGGVGGYFGGLLARHYEQNKNVEVYFMARGEHLTKIKSDGLKVVKGGNEFIARPKMATNDVNEIGPVDLILICTKTYDLENIIEQLRPAIKEHTMLLPLLNGVESEEVIHKLVPAATVLKGCVYIVASLKAAGVVENSGNLQLLNFGLTAKSVERLTRLRDLFVDAGVEAKLCENIDTVLWEKFIFISPTATATSFFRNTIGELLAAPEQLAMVKELIEETVGIARKLNIAVDSDIAEKTLNKLRTMPFAATSSMQRDYQSARKLTEVESLTGYVVRKGAELNIPTPQFKLAYQQLIESQKQIN